MCPLENRSNPPSTYTTLCPGFGPAPRNSSLNPPAAPQNNTSAPGCLAVSSVAYSLILSRIASPVARRSASVPGPSAPARVRSSERMKWLLVHSSMRPTRSVVEMLGVRLTTLKRSAALTKR